MSVTQLDLYHADGRMKGTYVYMLLCRDAGPVYVKVGTSERPSRRLLALRGVCVAEPRQFCYTEVGSRGAALAVERGLNLVLEPWRTEQEWFAVPLSEKQIFNAAQRFVLTWHRSAAWQRVRVRSVIRLGREVQRLAKGRWAA